MSKAYHKYTELTHQNLPWKDCQILLKAIIKNIKVSTDPIGEVMAILENLSTTQSYKFMNFLPEKEQLMIYFWSRFILLDVLESFDNDYECGFLISTLRQTYYISFEEIFPTNMMLEQYYTSLYLKSGKSTPKFFTEERADTFLTNQKKTKINQRLVSKSFRKNLLRNQLFNIRDQGILLK